MGKVVKKRDHPNPTGKGGFGERPQDRKPGPGRGHKKPVQQAGEQVVSDMEKGYSTPEGPTDTVVVKGFRRLAHDDLLKFTQLYVKMKELAGPGDGLKDRELTAAATAEAGPKEERVEELAERLLREWELEEGNGNGKVEEADHLVGGVPCVTE